MLVRGIGEREVIDPWRGTTAIIVGIVSKALEREVIDPWRGTTAIIVGIVSKALEREVILGEELRQLL